MEDLLSSLNDAQKEAVRITEGPLLILAGAGTGKTKTITTRMAYILKKGLAQPSEILAVTFTNKASNELKERVQLLVGEFETLRGPSEFWIGTFHATGLRILRMYPELVGLRRGFNIADTADSKAVVQEVLEELGINLKEEAHEELRESPDEIRSKISKLKNKALYPEEVGLDDDITIASSDLKTIYRLYTEKLRRSNRADFDDLLFLCVKLFQEHLGVLHRYQDQFKYILVDEYQDTNDLQHKWLTMLAAKHYNICCVGDDDQSIYSWRGANVQHILAFKQQYADACILTLDQNYRSTQPILEVASRLIHNNSVRHPKKLWCTQESEDNVTIHECINNYTEAELIAEEIVKYNREGYDFKDMAVLVRAGYQARVLENVFRSNNIPHALIGGIKFYERAEVKDAISYISLMTDQDDNIAFKRVVNSPKRGVGQQTLNLIAQVAEQQGLSLFKATLLLLETGGLKGRGKDRLEEFTKAILSAAANEQEELYVRVGALLESSGYLPNLRDSLFSEKNKGKIEDIQSRLDNLEELLNEISNYQEVYDYLEHVNLNIAVDLDGDKREDRVSVMTLHAAKGLEFEVVFLPGWVKDIFPSTRGTNVQEKIEEERRLAYVGLTRAKRYLHVLYSLRYLRYKSWDETQSSLFVKELEGDCINFKPQANFVEDTYYNVARAGFRSNSVGFRGETLPGGNATVKAAVRLKPGVRVAHQEFGQGKVIAVNNNLVQVQFDSKEGAITVMASFLSKA